MNKALAALACLWLGLAPLAARGQEYTPSPENLAARQWFQDAKFGMFIHWGVYSVLGRGEWVMHNENIPVSEYEKLPPQFNPVNYDPDEWCRIAAAAGVRYITITSKHHDGFAMWDSKISDYDIVERTPYKKDVLKMLAEACQRHGIKLFFYHSQLDWHNPDYWPRGSSYAHGRPESGDWNKYLDYMDTQLSELLTGYGPIGGIWFDGMWEKPDADWRLSRTYGLIHKLQPAAMVGSNHHVTPFAGEDFQMFEKGLPGADPYNKGSGISVLPLETCATIGESWGYDSREKSFQSVKELVHYLVKAAGNNANFLLNVGPRPDGTIQPEQVERLEGMGKWLGKYGESVYGTRGGPWGPSSWGVSTQKAGKVYVHLLEPDAVVSLPPAEKPVRAARLLTDGQAVQFENGSLGLVLSVPPERRDSIDTVVELEF